MKSKLEAAISHMRTKKEDFLIWENENGDDFTTEIQNIIDIEHLPYRNNGCFMGCHSWQYIA